MQHPSRLTFAGFEIDLQASVLRKNGEPVRISRQAFRALALLVTRGGELVTRDELKREIWGDRVHGDFEHGLNVCIGMVRAALGDDTEGRPIVVTCPREGYRLGVTAKPVIHAAWTSLNRWYATAAAVAVITAGYVLIGASAGGGVADSSSAVAVSAPILRWNPASLSRTWATPRSDAYEWYLRGRAYYDRSTGRKPVGAFPYFERAVALDSRFTLAHAALAVSYLDRVTVGIEPQASVQKARQEAQRALELDPRAAETRVALAELSYRVSGDNATAEREFVQAVKLEERNAYVRQRYAVFLQAQQRLDDALVQLNVAVELNPLSVVSSWQKAYALLQAGRFNAALTEAYRTLELDPNHAQSLRTIGLCLEALGRREEAIEAYLKAGRAGLGHLGRLYALMGDRGKAREILAALDVKSDTTAARDGVAIAYIYAGLNEPAAAVKWLEKARRAGRELPISLRLTPQWEPLRGHHAFDSFVKNSPLGGI